MIYTLMASEIRKHLLDGRFIVCSLIVIILCGAGTFLAVSDFVDLRDADTITRTRTEQGFWSHGVRHLFLYVTDGYQRFSRPMGNQQILVSGSERNADRTVTMEFRRLPQYEGDPLQDPLPMLFPSCDLIFMVGVLINLMAILFSYNAVTAEREEGTLAVLLASPVSRGTVIIGKWLGGLVSLLIPCLIAMTAMLLVLSQDPRVGLGSTDVVTIFLLCLLGGLYVAAVYTVSIFVSIRAPSSGLSLLILLLWWVLTVVAIPAVSAPLGYVLTKGLSQGAAESQVVQHAYADYSKQIDSLLATLGVVKYDQLSSEAKVLYDAAQCRLIGQRQQDVRETGRQCLQREEKVNVIAGWINRISPFGCFENCALAIARCGPDHDARLNRYNLDYTGRWVDYYGESIKTDVKGIDISNGPKYRWVREGLPQGLRDGLLDVALLMAELALFLLLSYRSFVKLQLS